MNNLTLRSSIVLLLGLVVCSFTFAGNSGYKAGDVARDFSLKNVDGRQVSLAQYKETRGFIIAFTCNHCPFAKMYESRIMDLDKQFAARGYPVIAISPNDPVTVPEDSWNNMITLAKQKHYSFPYLIDETQDITKAYGATNTPHVFVLQKESGKLVVKYVGAIDDNAQDASEATKHYVADAVNSLLANEPVAVSKTKAIGCSIKWRNS